MTLDEIIKDIMLVVRNSNITSSEKLSVYQIESWIHQYRAVLFKQSYDKNQAIDDTYIQTLSCIELEIVDSANCVDITIKSGCSELRTNVDLPKFLMTSKGNCITSLTDIYGKPIQINSPQTIYYMTKRRFTAKNLYAFWDDDRIHVVGTKTLKYINISGVFADPTKLADYYNNCRQMQNFTYESQYPLSENLIPVIKDMILQKELRVMTSMPTDQKNDSQAVYTPNVRQQ